MTADPPPIKPARTEDLAVTEYDAGRHANQTDRHDSTPGEALSTNDEAPEVGLLQKGDGEEAVVKRETEI